MDHYLDRARGTQLYTGKKMRSRFLLGSLALTTCLTRQAIVVAPKPSVRADSVARGAFARSALDLLEQVANADSLDLVAVGATGRECFTRRDFHVCGHMQDSVVIIEFVQGGTSSFSDGNKMSSSSSRTRLVRTEFESVRRTEASVRTSHRSIALTGAERFQVS
jgi:hypothetical protein